jgi:hypothetical protein
MKPVEFEEQNIIMGKDQPEYQPLPAFRDPNGTIVSCWELSPEEIERVKETGCIWFSQLTFNRPMQPILLSTEKSDHLILKEG